MRYTFIRASEINGECYPLELSDTKSEGRATKFKGITLRYITSVARYTRRRFQCFNTTSWRNLFNERINSMQHTIAKHSPHSDLRAVVRSSSAASSGQHCEVFHVEFIAEFSGDRASNDELGVRELGWGSESKTVISRLISGSIVRFSKAANTWCLMLSVGQCSVRAVSAVRDSFRVDSIQKLQSFNLLKAYDRSGVCWG